MSTGSSKMKKKFKIFNLRNWFISDYIFDKIKMKNRLKESKKIVIRSLNLQSLEMASRLSSQFPNKQILIIDSQKKTSLHETLGPHVASELIQLLKDKGIYFNLGRGISDLNEKMDGRIRIELEKNKTRNNIIVADMVIDADDLVIGNSDLLKTK
jgi:hypothetical protein